MYDEAEGRYKEKLDILNIMGVVNNASNFMKNFLTREQRILLKFDAGNIISAGESEECCGGGGSGEESFDPDDRMIANLSHPNGLCAMFTLARLTNVLKPLTQKKLSEFEINLIRSFYNKDATDGNNGRIEFGVGGD